jgi:nitrite reductase/ring-hydroxylating ferredoxin subunit
VQEVYARDRTGVPPVLQCESQPFFGDEPLSTDAYTSRAFHDLEMERMWPRVWQVAGREEEIPRVGDHLVYEIGDHSLIVVRAADDSIKAFHNSCLHRGTQLRAEGGNVQAFRCPFHSFTWNLDGTLKHVPCRWDLPQVRAEAFRLPEARVGTWGGFVFVNLDPDAVPLAEYLEDVPAHFACWPLDRRVKAAHVAKVVNCNWKVAIEAFIEVFHLVGLHPESLPILGDTNSQYDVFEGRRHTNRMINLSGVASPHLRGFSESRVLEAAGRFGLCPPGISLPESGRARDAIADAMRERLRSELGIDLSSYSDAEILDVIQYTIFPNFLVFGGLGSPLAYRVRPHGNDPNVCVFEVMLLLPVSDGAERLPAAPMRWLASEEPWSSVEALGYFGRILDQDFAMMPRVQRGLRASACRKVTLSCYQEVRIRHQRRVLDDYLRG